jgi:translation initiation factor 3 subunit B
VNIVEDFAKFAAVSDAYAPPEAKPFAPREDLMSWLLDPRGRDQFAARFADETEIYWNDAHSKRPEEVYRRTYWTESYVQWSPRGNYLTTVHRQGIALWGGPGFPRLARMQHPGIQFLEYSPGEKYIATCSVTEPTNPRESVSVSVAFFDVRSGRKLRAFAGGLEDFLLPGAAGAGGGRSVRGACGWRCAPGWLLRCVHGAVQSGALTCTHSAAQGFTWPVFKWAGGAEDKYFAKIGKNAISIYEARTAPASGRLSVCQSTPVAVFLHCCVRVLR